MGDRHWDPLWETAVELNLPLSFHIGSGDMEDGLGREKVAAYGRMSTFTSGSVDVFLKNGFQMSELLLSGIFVRHPEVQFVSVESGVGWIPFTLEALDYQFMGNRVFDEHPEFDRLPSEYFKTNVHACYWFEQVAPRRLIDKVGVDRIMFETDFPHPTSLYGDDVHDARSPTASATPTRRPAARSCGRTARSSTRSSEPTPADEEKVAALSS